MVSKSQKDKAELLLKFHHDKEILVILNSWDVGSSKLIEACGFKAIGTTSMGVSASLGYADRQAIPFSEMLGAISRICGNVSLPVTVDIEGGYGKNTGEIINSIKQIISTGAVGINIEDSTGLNPKLLDEDEFCTRISAIRELSDSHGFHLVINARTDVFLASHGEPGNRLSESIHRGNKYKDAGADCIFVPCVWEKDKITQIVKGIKAPVNILTNPTNRTGLPPTIRELENIGVSRVSVGSAMMKATLNLIKKVAEEFIQKGTYDNFSTALEPMDETIRAYEMSIGLKN
jgi:2-methylisocitrate lyase-like PEP mutase family enzyme